MQEPQSLCRQITTQLGDPSEVAARAVETRNQTPSDGIGAAHEHNGNSCRRGLGRADRSLIGSRYNQRHLLLDQFGGKRLRSFIAIFGKTVLDRNVLALYEARFSQASMKCRNLPIAIVAHAGMKIPNHRQLGLLRPRRQRPRRRRGAEVPRRMMKSRRLI